MSVVKSVGEKIDEQELAKIFRDEGMSNYFVVYLRLITSCQLQKEADFYQNFLDGGKSMVEFCKTVCRCYVIVLAVFLRIYTFLVKR